MFYTILPTHTSANLGRTNMSEPLLNSREVAATLHVSRSYAYLLMRRGDIPAVRLGRLVRVRQGDLDAYVRLQARRSRGRKPALSVSAPLNSQSRRSSHT
jgi:excisionase family DNA binding protein